MFKTTLLAPEASAGRNRRAWRAAWDKLARDQLLRWPLWNPIALASGAATYLAAPVEPPWAILLAPCLVAGVLSLATFRIGQGGLSFALGLLCMAALGGVAGKVRAETAQAPSLTRQTSAVRVEGVLVEIDASDKSRRFRLRVHAIEGLPAERTPHFVRFSVKDTLSFAPGQSLACRAILSPPPRPAAPGEYAFHRDAYFQQLGAVGFSIGACTPLSVGLPRSALEKLSDDLGAYRRNLASAIYKAAGEKGGPMAAALTTGDRSFINADDADALRGSGLAHLLSISGLHMALAGGIFFFAIRMVWRLIEPLALRAPADRVAAAGAIIGCTFYLILAGAEVATVRSYVMALIAFGAKLFDRPALSIRSLAVALVLAVLVQPETVLSPGFQMSYAATGALIALYEAWPRRKQEGRRTILSRAFDWIAVTTGTSIVASTATAPFALFHFNRSAPLSILANLATSPIISLWTAHVAALAAFFSLFGLQDFFLRSLGDSLAIVQAVANWASDAAPAIDWPRMSIPSLALYSLSLAILCIHRGLARIMAVVPAVVATAVWITQPRLGAIISTDATVFVRLDDTSWTEITSWRERNGLDPLSIEEKLPFACAKTEATCTLQTPDGTWTYENAPKRGCEPQRRLVFMPADSSAELSFDPCEWSQNGGALLQLTRPGRRLEAGHETRNRPWDAAVTALPPP